MENLYTSKEAADHLGVTLACVREVEDTFKVPSLKTSGNRKFYTESSVFKLKAIIEMREKGDDDKKIKMALEPDRVVSLSDILSEGSESDPQADTQKQEEDDLERAEPFFDEPLDGFYQESEAPKLSESVGLQIQALGLSAVDLISLIQTVGQLKEEVSALKSSSAAKEAEQLTEENAKLKEKVKEKTYEVLELREQLKQLMDKQQKKGFFSKL